MSSTTPKLKILYAEGESEVLDSQTVRLQQAGHQIDKAEGRKATYEAIQRQAYDLVILGSSLSRNDRHHLPYIVKKAQSGTPVLVLHADGGRHPQVDAFLDSGTSMELLLETISSKFSKASSRAQAAGAGR